MRVSRLGWTLIALAVATVVVTLISPGVGFALAIVLALVLLIGLAEGLGGAHAGHESLAATDAERRREARTRPDQGPGPGGV